MEVRGRIMSKKKKKRLLVEYIYKIVMLGLEAASFVLVWTQFYTPLDIHIRTEVLKVCFMALVYAGVYHIFAKFYKAYRIGAYRTTELMYFHFLAMGITNVLFFMEGSIYKHRVLSVFPIIGIYIVQWIIAAPITLMFNRGIAKVCELRKCMIVYGKESYIEFMKKMESKQNKFKIIGAVSQERDFEEIIKAAAGCTAVYAFDVDECVSKKLILYCTVQGIDIYLTRDVEEIIAMGYETSHTFDTPFIRTRKEKNKVYYPFAKRMVDIVFSILGLIVMSPILLIVALLIKMYDGGPVFYKQVRLTKGHKEFEIYKFRSMIVNAEKDGKARLAAQGDNRVTPVGKVIRATRIDEFPQLINVLKGEMSIAGPRPERPEIEKDYLKVIPEFGLRLQTKAGLTGYAQVFGKYNTTPTDKLKLDLLYINQQNFWMDLKLMLWTVKILFIPESTEGIDEGATTAIRGEKEK